MTKQSKQSTKLNWALWLVQAILAATLVWASAMKLFQPTDKLAAMWPWTANNTALVTISGMVDLLGAIGLVLPGLLGMQPRLTVYASWGIMLLMLSASIFHISRGEASQIGVNIVVAALAAFIAWGRSRKAPLATI